MRRSLITLATLLLAQGIASAHAGDINVGVSVAGEIAPGVYGRIDVGNSRPVLVYQQPVIIRHQPRPVRPVYMHVPPGHAKNWGKHCGRYDACGVPVYFVKSAEYEPRRSRREHHGHEHHERKHHERKHHEREHDDDRGHGRGHGHGHGKH